MNAIIFLAPIHCFDERLPEDNEVSRLEDSVMLWNSICKNKVLRNVRLILVRFQIPPTPADVFTDFSIWSS